MTSKSKGLCLSSILRILEVRIICDCRMPEFFNFGFSTSDMTECELVKIGFMTAVKKAKKYFTIDSAYLDYFCIKIILQG